jgi:hypothetical protein
MHLQVAAIDTMRCESDDLGTDSQPAAIDKSLLSSHQHGYNTIAAVRELLHTDFAYDRGCLRGNTTGILE